MGKFQERLDAMGHMVATSRIHEWIADFVLEYSDKKVWERDAVVRKWFG